MAEGVPFDSVYARRLETLLASAGGSRRAEVINAGVSGYSLFQGLTQLERELLPCRPDVVTALFGINDQDSDQGVSDAEKARLFDSPLVTLRQTLNRSMLWYFLQQQAWQIRGWIFGKTPVAPTRYANPSSAIRRMSVAEYERGLERLVDLSVAYDFRPVFLVLPTSPYAYDPSLAEDEPAPMPAPARGRPGRGAHTAGRGRYERGRRDPLADTRGVPALLRGALHARPVPSGSRRLRRRSSRVRRSTLQQSIFARYADAVRRVAARRASRWST